MIFKQIMRDKSTRIIFTKKNFFHLQVDMHKSQRSAIYCTKHYALVWNIKYLKVMSILWGFSLDWYSRALFACGSLYRTLFMISRQIKKWQNSKGLLTKLQSKFSFLIYSFSAKDSANKPPIAIEYKVSKRGKNIFKKTVDNAQSVKRQKYYWNMMKWNGQLPNKGKKSTTKIFTYVHSLCTCIYISMPGWSMVQLSMFFCTAKRLTSISF